jgi:hypothetical protein
VHIYSLTQLKVVFIIMCSLLIEPHVSAVFSRPPSGTLSGDVITYNHNFVTYEISYFRLKMLCCLIEKICKSVD